MEGTAVQYSITGLQILAHAIMLFFLTAKKDYAIFFKKILVLSGRTIWLQKSRTNLVLFCAGKANLSSTSV
jgi:hypothetical protein